MKRLVKFLRARLFAGLLVLAPLAFTIIVLVRVFHWLDGLLAPLFEHWLGRSIPGLGLLATLLLLFLTGVVARHFAGSRIIAFGEWIVSRIPLVRSLHRTAKDLLSAVALPDSTLFREVVLVEYPRPGIFAYGFVTSYTELADGAGRGRMAHVFIPNPPVPSTGALVLVPEGSLLRLDLSREEALKRIVSAGLVSESTLELMPERAAGESEGA